MDIKIETGLDNKNTKLFIDGEEITSSSKIVSIDFMAMAPNKKYNEDARISISYNKLEDGKITNVRHATFGGNDADYKSIGMEDLDLNDFVASIGEDIEDSKQTDSSKEALADAIIAHCAEKKIACPEKDVLLNRTEDSLKDKMTDLSITIEGVQQ